MPTELLPLDLTLAFTLRIVATVLFITIAFAAGNYLMRWRREQRAHRAAVVAARARVMRREDKLARIRSLAERIPLSALIDFIFEGEREISLAARAAIDQRPALRSELADMLRSDDRIRALKYLWLHVAQPPLELAPAFHDCVSSLPAWGQRRFPAGGLSQSTEFEWACRAIPRLAERLAGAGLEFRGPIGQLAAYLRHSHPRDGWHYLALLESATTAPVRRKVRLGTTLWESCRDGSSNPMLRRPVGVPQTERAGFRPAALAL